MSERNSECRYCGQTMHGYGCPYGPDNIHVEQGDADHCIYCGSTNYGFGCSYSIEEDHLHKHGHGDRKCVWCGQQGVSGPGCPYSPDHKHHM